MSHLNIAKMNKHQKHPKAFFEQYLYNSGEPEDDTNNDTPPELEAELLENSYIMRRHLRRVAKRLRKNRY